MTRARLTAVATCWVAAAVALGGCASEDAASSRTTTTATAANPTGGSSVPPSSGAASAGSATAGGSSAPRAVPGWAAAATAAGQSAAAHRGGESAETRLRVPRLGVEAPVLSCGTESGVVEPPGDVRATCLWSGGAPLNAAAGTSVVVGHSTRSRTSSGALERIRDLRPGDPVELAGSRWRVAEVAAGVDKHALPAWVTATDGPRTLALVTCDTSDQRNNDVVRLEPAP